MKTITRTKKKEKTKLTSFFNGFIEKQDVSLVPDKNDSPLVSSVFVSAKSGHISEKTSQKIESNEVLGLLSSAFVSTDIEQIQVKKSLSEETTPENFLKTAVVLNDRSDMFENVFVPENQVGRSVILYLSEYADEYKETEKAINLAYPTYKAFEAEKALVKGIQQRTASLISSNTLKRVLAQYIKTHIRSFLSEKWTGEEVPHYYLRLFLNGKEMDAFTCNYIQVNIITAFWENKHSELSTKSFRV